ncbi:MAG: hypothetical protein J5507_04415 [Clostridia bacterium]|nr:hypothetical protein [Clostridia bacterium]
MREKYNPDNIFKKKYIFESENQLPAVKYNENIFIKIIRRIKEILKIT